MTIDLNTFAPAPAFPGFSLGELTAALGLPDEPYTIRVVGMDGALITELTTDDPTDPHQAHPEDIIETLNAPLDFSITFPKHAFDKSQVDLLGVPGQAMELQVLLGGEVIAWGPAIAEQGGSGSGSITLRCAGVDWYFAKRAIDEEPVNLLSYGGFEHGDFAGWRDSGSWAGGTIGDPGISAVIETDNVFQGTYAARLTGFVPANGGLALVSNPATFTAGPLGNRLTLTFSACVELFITPALFDAGVVVVAGPPGSPDGTVAGGVNAKASAVWRLDASTATNVELRQSLEVRIPPGRTWNIQVLVFAPTGIVVFDHFFLRPHKKLDTASFTGSPTVGVDVSRIARMILEHTLSDLHHHNKSDLHIGLDTPNCGVKQARVYEFNDHVPVDQALNEFLARDDCFEAQVAYTPTTRTYRLFPIAAGGMGRDLSGDVNLIYGQAPVASYATSIDGAGVVTNFTELGDGNGLEREEGWATDESAIGGTTLQGAGTAPSGAPFNSLEPIARAQVAQRKRAAEVIEVTITREHGGLVDTGDTVTIVHDFVKLGDRITFDAADGWHDYSGVWRIVRIARHCRARTKTLTLNKVFA